MVSENILNSDVSNSDISHTWKVLCVYSHALHSETGSYDNFAFIIYTQ